MTKTVTARIAAVFCTVVMSATCMIGALAPAGVNLDKPVAAERQFA